MTSGEISKNRGLSSKVLGAAWRLEDDDAYQPNTSPSLEDTPFAQTCTQLYYTAPPQAQQTTSGDRSPKNGSNGSLVKLARRFSQRGERKEVRAMPLSSDDSQPQHRQRSVSVDSDYESDFSYASAPHDWLINVLLTEEYKRLFQKSPEDYHLCERSSGYVCHTETVMYAKHTAMEVLYKQVIKASLQLHTTFTISSNKTAKELVCKEETWQQLRGGHKMEDKPIRQEEVQTNQ
ncbi:putative ankyrin repeat and fibronectin type-III domain-containing protein 1 [Apostichopus japonicus]|uniref:Putative ankyrin repeat and fibronectin type-III domain-containing protein 1 n=1 Tax=Stichopus japonicus TaxID=307972 RepID=A0A2G8KCB8_STIJA|nr:putative ankyrin repeat and fibronectin type-III domain-containing protein 1 [Apostichopus japonicus]